MGCCIAHCRRTIVVVIVCAVVCARSRSRRRGAWIREALHGGGSQDGDRCADGALPSKINAAPLGEVDAVENVVIQEDAFRDIGVDYRSRNGGRKVGVGKGSQMVAVTRDRRLAAIVATVVVGGTERRGEIRRSWEWGRWGTL